MRLLLYVKMDLYILLEFRSLETPLQRSIIMSRSLSKRRPVMFKKETSDLEFYSMDLICAGRRICFMGSQRFVCFVIS